MEIDIKDRFIKYVSFNTQSDETSPSCPSSEGQLLLGKYVEEELKAIGFSNVEQDENGYVYATLPASEGSEDKPVLAYIAHMDVADDAPGDNVRVVIEKTENGEIIRTDGETLLGADDKAGMAEIVTACEKMLKDRTLKHPEMRIVFTPDEEIGRGVEKIDMSKVNASYAFTADGSEIGELTYECFNASSAVVVINGVSAHLGFAYKKMINSVIVAEEFIGMIPRDIAPENTRGTEGYLHVDTINGRLEKTEIRFVIRDFREDGITRKKDMLIEIAKILNKKYGDGTCSVEFRDGYRNMKSYILPEYEFVIDNVRKAYREFEIEPFEEPVRGGTDGATLSSWGLPTPNLGTGAIDYHGRKENISVKDLELGTSLLIKIAEQFA